MYGAWPRPVQHQNSSLYQSPDFPARTQDA
ncbi:peptide synthetase, partial [Salmonella enterica subsp. enterica]|nr:peptide synthetase [Salmonella enterica subsp. enterica serovar Enteritidis]